jgi:ubiquinone/menaquinone biosynthesis C-methylase UbiE
MDNRTQFIKDLYQSDEYISKNPSLHEEDFIWKVTKITPLIDSFFTYCNKSQINLLDVGGGAGLILNATTAYIESNYGVRVNKFALDLSPGMLKIQQKNNPDLKKALNEDIRRTSLSDKEMDITLMIDVLEHIPNPMEALEELKRISDFVIFKVPLSSNFVSVTLNLAKGGKPRRREMEDIGHINFYRFDNLSRQIEKHIGRVLHYSFTNVSSYFNSSEHYQSTQNSKSRIKNFVSDSLFKLSPRLCSLILFDFVVMLVRSY